MTYPQYPGPYGPYPNPYPGQVTQPNPSRATAITTGVLALLDALALLTVAVAEIGEGIMVGFSGGLDIMRAVTPIVIGPILIIGAIMLFRRKTTGHNLVLIGAALAIAVPALIGVWIAIDGNPSRLFAILGQCVFAAVTLIFAAVEPTKRWVRAGGHQRSANGFPPQPPMHPAYPQQQPPPQGYAQQWTRPPGW